MLTKRIIACLDVDAGRVVKGIRFLNLKDAGDPAELAAAHSEAGADEIVLLDISATHENRNTLLETVRRTARQLFIPFTVGGGVRTLEDAGAIFDAGADKISMNSAAIATPDLITEIANRFGSQAAIVAIDAKRDEKTGGFEAWVQGGRRQTGQNAITWARQAEDRGAGTGQGFDCVLTKAVANAVRIPVIASGGAGNAQHFTEVFKEGHADAALAASIFHFGLRSIAELKQQLQAAGIPMRCAC